MGLLIVFIIMLGFAILIAFASRETVLENTAGNNLEIERWARENNYQIRAMQLSGINVIGSRSPFTGKLSLGQFVYRVVVTPIGEEKRRVAWIRLGAGLTSSADEFTLIWEDEWRPPEPPIG